jgi:hypothetical protein
MKSWLLLGEAENNPIIGAGLSTLIIVAQFVVHLRNCNNLITRPDLRPNLPPYHYTHTTHQNPNNGLVCVKPIVKWLTYNHGSRSVNNTSWRFMLVFIVLADILHAY